MDIIVNDTNIFIDLHSVDLLEKMCLLPFEIHTVDFVIDEIKEPEQRQVLDRLIDERKVYVRTFSSEEVMEIALEHSHVPGNLSITDIAVCHYAESGPFKVITGDRQMRNYAESKKLEVHGILYLFDKMIENDIIPPNTGATKLIELRAINSRLPKSEIEARIERWSRIRRV